MFLLRDDPGSQQKDGGTDRLDEILGRPLQASVAIDICGSKICYASMSFMKMNRDVGTYIDIDPRWVRLRGLYNFIPPTSTMLDYRHSFVVCVQYVNFFSSNRPNSTIQIVYAVHGTRPNPIEHAQAQEKPVLGRWKHCLARYPDALP
jgi:hypothetical protein